MVLKAKISHYNYFQKNLNIFWHTDGCVLLSHLRDQRVVISHYWFHIQLFFNILSLSVI